MALQTFPEPAAGLQDPEACAPETEGNREAICTQLERLLASSVFRNSKRCSDLLAYLVHRALDDDRAGHLKERTIGIEVFGRAPDYDTTTDHVVRSMAGEVRKRLAQFYMEPGHSTEIRIDVPSGNYIARFQLPPAKLFQESGNSIPEEIELVKSRTRRIRSRLVAISILSAAAVALVALGIGLQASQRSGSTLDKFWRPVFSPPNQILLCIGNWDRPPGSAQVSTPQADSTDTNPLMTLRAFHGLESQKVFLNDAITLAKIAGLVQGKGQRFQIMSHSNATFADLQNGPAVLIGLRSNFWTGSLVSQLRFGVERGAAPHTLVITDKKNPSRHDWYLDSSTPYMQATKDYALVVRALDPKTGQMVVAAAGLSCFGTLAAGEFLTNPSQIKKLEAYAPRDWEHKNLAIVLSIDVIKASIGAPNVVAAEFW
jgi:hypothetical protein